MTTDTEKKDVGEKIIPPKADQSNAFVSVTSRKTIDFPALGWGIHEGEVRELPVEAEAQAIILANESISIIK